jgi:hypothetical protein
MKGLFCPVSAGSLVLLIALFAVPLVNGQIFISPDDFPNVTGLTLTYFTNITDHVVVNVGYSGPNQTWDFTEGPDSLQIEEQIVQTSTSPFYQNFPNANRTRVSEMGQFGLPGTVYAYREMSNEELILLGLGAEVMEFPIPIPLGEEGLLEYPMPLYYQDEWESTVELDTVFTIANPDTTIPLDSLDIRIELTLGDQAEVDAWGTAEGPLGNLEVLRVHHDTGIEITVSYWLFFVWIPIWQEEYMQIRYEWLAHDYGPIVTINSQPGETNPEFTDASRVVRLIDLYTGAPRNSEMPVPLTISLHPNYPNPFNEATTFAFALPLDLQGKATLSIYDILGRKVLTLWEGASDGKIHCVTWDGKNAQNLPVASGTYFGTLSVDCRHQSGTSFTRRIIKIN